MSLREVTCPIYLIQGTEDAIVTAKSAKKIHARLSSTVKGMWYIEGASHVPMNETRFKAGVFSRTLQFFGRF